MMNKVFSHMTMSLDGYIADPQDGCDELFTWYNAGEVEVPAGDGRRSFTVDGGTAAMLRDMLAGTGAVICGRRLFDHTNGWDDNHPAGAPVVVVTHRPPQDPTPWPRTSFVPDVAAGIAVAKEIAGDQDVTIASANIAAQALDLGLLDEVRISLAPVLLGEGIPYFADLARSPHRFDDPTIVAGSRATHLTYAVRRD